MSMPSHGWHKEGYEMRVHSVGRILWSAVAMVLLAAVFASPAAATESETAFCQVAPTKGAFCPRENAWERTDLQSAGEIRYQPGHRRMVGNSMSPSLL